MSSCPKHILKDYSRLFKKVTHAICEVCGDALCSEHAHQCPVCGKFLCDIHSVICSSCQARYCPDHIPFRSHASGYPLCGNCIRYCSICQMGISRFELKTCMKCGRVACTFCTTSNKGIIRKEMLCKDCAQLNT